MAAEQLHADFEIAIERGMSRDRAPREIIRLVYERPIPKATRMIRCRELFGSRQAYEERWKYLAEETGSKMLLCHRYELEVEN